VVFRLKVGQDHQDGSCDRSKAVKLHWKRINRLFRSHCPSSAWDR
jgi:hypothetical protein